MGNSIFIEKRPSEKLFFSGDHFAKNLDIQSDLLIGDLKNPSPEFTIMIPTFKRTDYLMHALDSVLKQDAAGVDFDILIVDNDCNPQSTTSKMLSKLSVPNLFYYQNRENLGPFGNWNRGIYLTRSKWVIALHDDDLLYPHALKSAVRAVKILDHGQLGAITAQIQSFNGFDDSITEPRRLTGSKREHILRNRAPKRSLKRLQFGLIDGAFSPTCGAVLNRSAVIEMGGYADDYKSDDMFFLYALSEKYECYTLKETWGKYRMAVNDTLNEETQALLIFENTLLNDYFIKIKQKGLIAAIDRHYRQKHTYMMGIYPLIDLVEASKQDEFIKKYFPEWSEYVADSAELAGYHRRQKVMAIWNIIIDYLFALRYKPSSLGMIEGNNGTH